METKQFIENLNKGEYLHPMELSSFAGISYEKALDICNLAAREREVIKEYQVYCSECKKEIGPKRFQIQTLKTPRECPHCGATFSGPTPSDSIGVFFKKL